MVPPSLRFAIRNSLQNNGNNNGQIQRITDNVDGTRTTSFTYDAWARLKSASNTQWTITETYDRYGNRKSQSAPVANNVTVDPNTNRLLDPGYAYDAAGNMTKDGANTLVYEGESRVVQLKDTPGTNVLANYTLDGNNLRVQKQVTAGATTVYVFSGTKVIAEYDNGAAPASPSREYVYSGSQLLATIESGITKYQISDHLSLRITTDSSGLKIADSGHYPFGENWYETGGMNKLKFTSYERDSESGNDYAMMRTSINRLGRLSSPDPFAGSIADPQSLNRYAYVLNDPSNLADPSGLRVQPLEDWGWDAWLGGGGGGTCYIDGFLSSCSMANALLRSGAGVAVPPGLAMSGFINGHFYYLTAHGDEEGDYLSFNYFGLSAAQIEALGLPSTIDVLGIGGGGQGAGSGGGGEPNTKSKQTFDQCVDSFGKLKDAADLLGLYGVASSVGGFLTNVVSTGGPLAVQRGAAITVANLEKELAPSAARLGVAASEVTLAVPASQSGALVKLLSSAKTVGAVAGSVAKFSGYVTVGATAVSLSIRGYCLLKTRGN